MLTTPWLVSHSHYIAKLRLVRHTLLATSRRQYAKAASRNAPHELKFKAGAPPADSSSGSGLGWPHPIASSEAITVHKSGFQGHAAALTAPPPSEGAGSLESLFAHLVTLFPRTKRATHCMYAWRTRAGAGAEAGRAQSGSCDGGESGAGERLERLLALGGCEDVVVVVYRWYGGVQLGSERWKCISGVAKQALRGGGFIGGGAEKAGETGKEEEQEQGRGSGKKGRKKR